MTKKQAVQAAEALAQRIDHSVTVYHDPASMGEQDGFDQPWGYCVSTHVGLLAPHRDTDHDVVIRPTPLGQKPRRRTTARR